MDGSDETFAKELSKARPSLRAFVGRLTPDYDEAEDVVAEAMRRAWCARDTFRRDASLTTWLFKIGRNTLLDGRKRKRHESVSLSALPYNMETVSDDTYFKGEQHIDPAILAALSDARPDEVAVIVRYYRGDSYAEIASTLGVPIGTVKSRIHNLRRFMSKKLPHYAI